MKFKDPTSKQVLDGFVYTIFAVAVITMALGQFKTSIDKHQTPPSDCFCPARNAGQ